MSDETKRQLHCNLFLHDTGHHEASWRLPGSDPHANLSLQAHQHLARVAEEARFDSVVPILQERGLFRTDYTGSTLREHYGLPRPENSLDAVEQSRRPA